MAARTGGGAETIVETILALSRRCARRLERSLPPVSYAREVLGLVLEAAAGDAALLWVRREDGAACHERRRDGTFRTTDGRSPESPPPAVPPAVAAAAQALLAALPDDAADGAPRVLSGGPGASGPGASGPGHVALVPLTVARERVGVLGLVRPDAAAPAADDAERVAAIGETVAVYVALHASRSALRERLKELQCLYDVMQLVTEAGTDLDAILRGMVGILPRAWLYPDVAEARITFEERVFESAGFGAVCQVQRATIGAAEAPRGRVEVGYREPRPPEHEGPFVREERRLLDSVAHDVGLIADRIEAQARRSKLEEQLRHAERLATIGQLAAGVAHELNEPLANVLGFGQLARKAPDLPAQAAADLDRVVEATLHARDVIRRLLLFARQSPTQVSAVDLNDLLEEVLGFFEVRWQRQGIRLVRALGVAPRPSLEADRAQLRQVLVNLLVNAAQAMPEGGRLTVRTRAAGDRVELAVEDTGCGMSDDVLRQIFLPFFTTKDVNEGTGLGLSVVHGIVTAHEGTVVVESAVGEGSRFTVSLPAGAAGALGPGDEGR